MCSMVYYLLSKDYTLRFVLASQLFRYLVQIEAEKQYRHKLVFQPCFSQEKEMVVSFALEIRRKNNMN